MASGIQGSVAPTLAFWFEPAQCVNCLTCVHLLACRLKFVEDFVGKHFNSWDEVIVASRSCWVGGAYTEGLGTTGPIYDTCHKLWWTMAFSMLIAPGVGFFSASIYMWSMIPLKYLLVPKMTEEKMKNGESAKALSLAQ
jgi:hypothetical protein